MMAGTRSPADERVEIVWEFTLVTLDAALTAHWTSVEHFGDRGLTLF
jgi:hypothetical protein